MEEGSGARPLLVGSHVARLLLDRAEEVVIRGIYYS